MSHRRLLSFPATPGRNSNPYLDILKTEFEKSGVAVRRYGVLNPFQTGDAFQLHWPERLYLDPLLQKSSILSELAYRNLIATVDRIQRRGGRLVWTVHNLQPHEPIPRSHFAVRDRWLKSILTRVNAVICMTENVDVIVRERFPEVRNAAFFTAPHPHYRDSYRSWLPRKTVRQDLGIDPDAFVIAMLGFVRRYKGIAEFIRTFRCIARADEILLIAGSCNDASYRDAITAEIGDKRDVRFLEKSLTPFELASLYKASDLALCNFVEILNSGTVLTALSLDVPVSAPAAGAMQEIARDVGKNWLSLFDPPLAADAAREILDRERANERSGRPMLDRYEPARVARQYLAAYGWMNEAAIEAPL